MSSVFGAGSVTHPGVFAVPSMFPFVLQHHVTIQQYMGTLENLLFTAELDHHILAVYQQFCALQL